MKLFRHLYISPGAMLLIGISWIALLAAFVWLATTAATISSLDKTDRIACRFLTVDASIRNQQAEITKDKTLEAERLFLLKADRFLDLLVHAPSTRANTESLAIFRDYVQAERDLVASLRDGSAQNVELSQQLADTGLMLAGRLHC